MPEPSPAPAVRPDSLNFCAETRLTPPHDSPGAAPGPSRFVIVRPLAHGGLGEVFVAQDKELDRAVALKRVQPRHLGNADVRKRFLREARITSRLEHPGIVPVYGLVRDEAGQASYAMRFIQGHTLDDAIQGWHASTRLQADAAAQRLGFRTLLQRFVSVCQTLAYAHSKGVIHRDLKPSNIMLGPFGEALVMDWGLAKELAAPDTAPATPAGQAPEPPVARSATGGTNGAESATPTFPGGFFDDGTQAGDVLGTPGFMSPEQAAGDVVRVGPASDIYSLGATLYVVLTGRSAFDEMDAVRAMADARMAQFPRPRQLRPNVPRALEAVCLKAMALNPRDRYASAQDLADDLERWLADEPVSCEREPWSIRAGRWMRRHRVLVGSGVAVLLLGLAALVGVMLLMRKHATALEDKNVELDQTNAQLIHASTEARNAMQRAVEAMEQESRAKDSARSAVELLVTDEMLTQLTHQDVKFLTNERRKLLGGLAAYYNDFAKSATVTATERERQATAYYRMGTMLKTLGQLTEAESAFRRLVEVRQQLASEFPDDRERRAQLATSHDELGKVLVKLRQFQAAEEQLRRNVDLCANLVADCPEVPRYREHLAVSHSNLGFLLTKKGLRRAAEQEHLLAKAVAEKLAAEFPANQYYRSALAKEYANLADTTTDLKRTEQYLRQALAIHEQLVADVPASASYRADLASAANYLGIFLQLNGQPAASLEWFAKSIRLLEPLVQQEPLMNQRHFTLRNAYHFHAISLNRLGRHAEAIPDWDRELQLKTAPADEPLIRVFRAESLAGAGTPAAEVAHEVAQAIALAYDLAAAKDVDDESLYNLACALALASALVKNDAQDRERYAASAVELLRHAVAKGNRDFELFTKDEDLLAIRERADFQQLLKQLRQLNSEADRHALRERIDDRKLQQLKQDNIVAKCRRLVEKDPNSAQANFDLAIALRDRGDLEESVTLYRRVIEMIPKDANAHDHLGWVLAMQSDFDGAIAEYRQAIACDPRWVPAHRNLATALAAKGEWDEAIASGRRSLELDPKDAFVRTRLAGALYAKGDFKAATVEWRMVLAAQPHWATEQFQLGLALLADGQFAEAAVALRKGRDLGAGTPTWPSRSAQRVEDAEQLVALAPRLPAILRGAAKPASAAERLGFAQLCAIHGEPALAFRLFAEAFADRPDLANDVRAGHRRLSAGYAARASSGWSSTPAHINAPDAVNWRRQAVAWLRADLQAFEALLAKGQAADRTLVRQQLADWQADPDLAGVRLHAVLAKLPREDRDACRQLWTDVTALLKRVQDEP